MNAMAKMFGSEHVAFFGFARVALLYALDLLDLRPGDTVLVPSFVCDSVLSPFNCRGMGTTLYPVRADLRADLDQAKRLADLRTKALLVVNYFGFPQDYEAIKAFCCERDLFLIEDNAHGFLSGDGQGLLGRHGDVAVTSFRKTLIVPNGAALVVNNPALQERLATTRPPKTVPTRTTVALKSAIRSLDVRLGGHLTTLYRRLQGDAHGESEYLTEEFDLGPYLQSCSRLSRWALWLMNVRAFAKRRRARFAYWLEYCRRGSDARAVWDRLTAGVVPMAFPLRADRPIEYIARLRADMGVVASRWPRLPQAVRDNIDNYPPFYQQVVTIPLDTEFGKYRAR